MEGASCFGKPSVRAPALQDLYYFSNPLFNSLIFTDLTELFLCTGNFSVQLFWLG